MAYQVTRAVGSVIVFAALCTAAIGQQPDERYDFDGVADMDPQPADPTDWMTTENWSDGGADPNPMFGPPIPDLGTRVEITTSTFAVDAPEIGPGDMAEAIGVRIGREDGEGLLTMSGGTLDTRNACVAPFINCSQSETRLRVGNDDGSFLNTGTFNISDGVVTTDTLWIGSGSQGVMNMSGGVVNTFSNLYLDWSFDSSSVLNMTGGTINVGTATAFPFRMHRKSQLKLDGGEILVSGSAELGTPGVGLDDSAGGEQTPDVTVLISNGLLQSQGFLQIGGSISIDGGILRANSYNESVSDGTIDVNGSGLLQFNNLQESVATVEALISSGVITTSGVAALSVSVVDVGGVDFTQVSVEAAGLAGDFDDDSDVDGPDFLVWQRGFPGMFTAGDLDDWQVNFGMSNSLPTITIVPEPAAAMFAMFGVLCVGQSGRHKQRSC